MAIPCLNVLFQHHTGDGRVVMHLEVQHGSKVPQVTHHGISVWEKVLGVVSKEQPAVVAE